MALTEHTHQHLTAHHRDFKAFAEAMVASHAGRFDETFWGFARQHAPSQVHTVVDIGTGPGLLLPDLVKRFPGAQAIGVDGQPEMLAKARELVKKNPGTRMIAHDVSSGQTPELEQGAVDVVVASMVFHELPVPTTLLDESARLLRPGGLLLLSDWIRQPIAQYSDGKRPADLDAFTHFSEHCRYTPEDVAWLVEKSGFKVVEWMARRNGRFILLAAHRLNETVVDGARS
jgi:SAM-dependent methyltransferase